MTMHRSTLAWVLMGALAAGLTGCGTVRTADPTRSAAVKAQAPSPSAGQVFVCRNGNLFGAGIRPTIEIDGQPVAVIGRSTYSFNEVKPGEHTIVAKTPEHDSKMSFSIAAGEQKYFSTWITMGVLVGRGVIDTMTPEEGRKCMADAELVEPEPAVADARK